MSFCACARLYGCVELVAQGVGEEDLAPPAANARADNTVARAQKAKDKHKHLVEDLMSARRRTHIASKQIELESPVGQVL